MTNQTPPLSPAERSRRYRARKRDGVYLVTVEVDKALLGGLASCGFVSYDLVDETDGKGREETELGVEMLMDAVADQEIVITDKFYERFD